MPEYLFNGRLLDVRPDRIDLRDREYRPVLRSLPAVYPGTDAIEYYLPLYEHLVLDQRSEGACTGFGLACVINFLQWSRGWREPIVAGLYDAMEEYPEPGEVTPVSPRMLYHLARFYDEWPGEDYSGSSCRGAMKGWHRHGVCSEEFWPYQDAHGDFVEPGDGWQQDAAQRRVGAYYRVAKDSVDDIQAAVFETGAVYVSAWVHDGWFPANLSSANGDALPVIRYDDARKGGHAFALVGYTSEGFIVQNSWGLDWGYHGFAVLTYEDWVANGMDAWVAALGAPTIATVPSGFVSTRQPTAGDGGPIESGTIRAEGYVFEHASVRPWSRDEALCHSVVLGNDGTPINWLVSMSDASAAVQFVSYERLGRWFEESGANRKVVLYAHGGLTDEDDALALVERMGPYFLANGIYPIFVVWKTGVLETLQGIAEDVVFGAEYAEIRTKGLREVVRRRFDAFKRRAREAADRAIEVAAERAVKPFWTQMKQNARAARRGGRGTQRIHENLAALREDFPDMEVHFIGHSAGAIQLGEMLDLFREEGRENGVASCTLWAPACTVEFALDHYKPAIEDGVMALGERNEHRGADPVKQLFAVEVLSDARELADSSGPYAKSLLYLVSRALEEYHKTPILGLVTAWTGGKPEHNPWAEPTLRFVDQWARFAKRKRIKLAHVVSEEQVSNGVHMFPSKHGGFDNDVAGLTRALRRILGRDPRYPVENLAGF